MKVLPIFLPILFLLAGCASGDLTINYKSVQDSQDSEVNQSTSTDADLTQ